jgi:hypothetical protein
MGAGLHGYNGVNPEVGIKLWSSCTSSIDCSSKILFEISKMSSAQVGEAIWTDPIRMFILQRFE